MDTVVAALDALSPAVVLCQLEIPLESVEAAARWTEQSGAAFVLNPSPFRNHFRRRSSNVATR